MSDDAWQGMLLAGMRVQTVDDSIADHRVDRPHRSVTPWRGRWSSIRCYWNRANLFPVHTAVLRTPTAATARFDPVLPAIEDRDFWLRLTRAHGSVAGSAACSSLPPWEGLYTTLRPACRTTSSARCGGPPTRRSGRPSGLAATRPASPRMGLTGLAMSQVFRPQSVERTSAHRDEGSTGDAACIGDYERSILPQNVALCVRAERRGPVHKFPPHQPGALRSGRRAGTEERS